MRSPDEVVDAVVAYLKSSVPQRCTTRDVEAPKGWFPHGYGHREIAAKEWPAVFVEEVTSTRELLEHTDDGDPVYDVTWQIAIEWWVAAKKSGAWLPVKKHRGALESAIVEALTDRPGMLSEGFIVGDDASISTDYSPLMKTKSGLPCCAEELLINIHTAEVVERAVLAEPPITVDVSVERLED